MLDAAETATGFVAGRQRSALDTDRMLSFALVRAVEIIGEAASWVGAETRLAMPTSPLPGMVAMRNRLIPANFD